MMDARKLLINLLYRATAQSSAMSGWSHRETKKPAARNGRDALHGRAGITRFGRMKYFALLPKIPEYKGKGG